MQKEVREVLRTRFKLVMLEYAREIEFATKFVKEIKAGIVHVNSQTAGAECHVPFGGMKDSSSGTREQGKAALEFFSQLKTVYFDPPIS